MHLLQFENGGETHMADRLVRKEDHLARRVHTAEQRLREAHAVKCPDRTQAVLDAEREHTHAWHEYDHHLSGQAKPMTKIER
jgi:hypothetical protein